jgi:hypothetical protein
VFDKAFDPQTSGMGIREIVDQRADASWAHRHVFRLITFKRPNIKVFDADGHSVSLEKLRRLADEEVLKMRKRTEGGRARYERYYGP